VCSSDLLEAQEIKNTYHYLMLLYLDLVIVEQKLIEAQYNVLAARTIQTLKLLKDNKYISQAEKEYQAQLLYGMALRWVLMADNRRVIVAKALEKPLQELNDENQKLEEEIEKYKHRPGGALRMKARFL
jgi:hypothetical protein